MTDLTEQWKKGELPEGHYYIKTRSETNIDEYIQWYKDHGIPSEKSFAYFNVQQVLAPVPTFDEWQAKLEENARLKERVSKLEKMQYSYTPEEWNTMLRTVNRTKELLKECRNILNEQTFHRNTCLETDETLRNRIVKKAEILQKIDEALR